MFLVWYGTNFHCTRVHNGTYGTVKTSLCTYPLWKIRNVNFFIVHASTWRIMALCKFDCAHIYLEKCGTVQVFVVQVSTLKNIALYKFSSYNLTRLVLKQLWGTRFHVDTFVLNNFSWHTCFRWRGWSCTNFRCTRVPIDTCRSANVLVVKLSTFSRMVL